MNDRSYLVGGRSEAISLVPPVFEVKMKYADGTWEVYRHIDLGEGYPLVLRSANDSRTIEEIRAIIDSWNLIP